MLFLAMYKYRETYTHFLKRNVFKNWGDTRSSSEMHQQSNRQKCYSNYEVTCFFNLFRQIWTLFNILFFIENTKSKSKCKALSSGSAFNQAKYEATIGGLALYHINFFKKGQQFCPNFM